jgi:hypothetical protein
MSSGDLFGADLLANPKIVTAGELKVPDIESLITDLPITEEAPIPKPKLVPSPEEVGPSKSWDGMENLNAESYLKPVSFGSSEPRMSDDAILKEKYDMLRKFERLNKLGVPVRKRFTMDSPLDEMRMELEQVKKDREMDASIRQFSQWFVTGMSALEWSSKNINAVRMFGLQLDGLSDSAQMNVGEFEEDFEELYELYGDKMKVHPLVRIPMRVCFMVYMVHLTNQMAQKAPIPNIQEIMRQNPEIGRQLAGAAMQQQAAGMRSVTPPMSAPAPAPASSNPLSGLMSFMSGTVQQPSTPPPAPIPVPTKSVTPKPPVVKMSAPTPAAPRREMKGPSGAGIADILNTIRQQAPPAPQQIAVPPPATAEPKKSAMRKAGSTGKNSVVIKL